MRITELPYEEEDESSSSSSSSSSFPYCHCNKNDVAVSSSSVEWKEDDTCIILIIPMSDGVRAKDVQVSMKHGILSVCGNYCTSSSNTTATKHCTFKRRRLCSREFNIYTMMVKRMMKVKDDYNYDDDDDDDTNDHIDDYTDDIVTKQVDLQRAIVTLLNDGTLILYAPKRKKGKKSSILIL